MIIHTITGGLIDWLIDYTIRTTFTHVYEEEYIKLSGNYF